MTMSDRTEPEEAPISSHDGRPISAIIDTFVIERGDLSEQYAREQLARASLNSAEVRELVDAVTNIAAALGITVLARPRLDNAVIVAREALMVIEDQKEQS